MVAVAFGDVVAVKSPVDATGAPRIGPSDIAQLLAAAIFADSVELQTVGTQLRPCPQFWLPQIPSQAAAVVKDAAAHPRVRIVVLPHWQVQSQVLSGKTISAPL